MTSRERFTVTLAAVVAVGMLIVLGRAAMAQVGVQAAPDRAGYLEWSYSTINGFIDRMGNHFVEVDLAAEWGDTIFRADPLIFPAGLTGGASNDGQYPMVICRSGCTIEFDPLSSFPYGMAFYLDRTGWPDVLEKIRVEVYGLSGGVMFTVYGKPDHRFYAFIGNLPILKVRAFDEDDGELRLNRITLVHKPIIGLESVCAEPGWSELVQVWQDDSGGAPAWQDWFLLYNDGTQRDDQACKYFERPFPGEPVKKKSWATLQ